MQSIAKSADEIKAVMSNAVGTPAQRIIALALSLGITSTAEIAAMVGVSDRAIRKAKAELQDLPRNSSTGTTVPAEPQYRNHSTAPGTPVPQTEPQFRNSSSDSASRAPAHIELPSEVVYISEEVKEEKVIVRSEATALVLVETTPLIRALEDLDEKFEQFWRTFPAGRKRAKGKCRWMFRNIASKSHFLHRATADEMIAAAREYAASKPDPQFVPMPLTWLNQGRWEDDPTESRRFDDAEPSKPVVSSAAMAALARLQGNEVAL